MTKIQNVLNEVEKICETNRVNKYKKQVVFIIHVFFKNYKKKT